MRADGHPVVLITGASSGIGAATARLLAARAGGARLLLHGRDGRRLRTVAAATGGEALAVELADPGAGAALAEEAERVHGRVDVLVNNAGHGFAGPLAAMSDGEVERLVAVNLVAPIELTRALLPGMLGRGRGRVAFVTSIAGRTGVGGEAVYAASKGGLDTFAESLRLELAGSGVGIGVVVPGVVDTAFFAHRGRPYGRRLPRPVPAERVAEAVVRAITGRPEGYVPRWLGVPVVVRATLPGFYRALAGRFGGSGG